LVFRRPLDDFSRIGTEWFDLHAVVAGVFDGVCHKLFADALSAKLFIHLRMIDRNSFAVRRFYVRHLGDPFAVLVYKESSVLPVLFSLNIHIDLAYKENVRERKCCLRIAFQLSSKTMKIYDITVPISNGVPIYKGDPTANVEAVTEIAKGAHANISKMCFGVHTGTHVDAPNHFIDGRRRADQLDLEKLIGKCRVIEIDENVDAIEPQHLGDLDGVERVLFKTRNSRFWNEPERGFRTDFTYISPGAARFLVEKGIKLAGIDYLSVEKFGSEDFATHITFLEKEVVIIEGVDLREVESGDYELICLPLKYLGGEGDGAPARTILRTSVKSLQ
jgi:arylformamidase